MIGRYHSNLTGIVPALAGQGVYLPLVLYADVLKQNPSDLTGFTAQFTLLDTDNTALVAATTANGGVVISGVAGTINVMSASMSPAHDAIPAGAHHYTFELYNASGLLELYITGSWTFDPDLSP